MKGKDAKINRIFTAIGCLAVALALAAFSCFAWFASNNKAQNDLTATVSSGNITDLTVNYYSLTGKTESGGTTTYTVYKDLGEEDGANGVAIGAYGSTGSTATLIKVSYTVKDGTATQIIFAGSGTATFPATLVTKTVNEEEKDFYSTTMSSAVSLRLTDSNSYTITPKLDNNGDEYSDTPTTITTSKTAQTFCDVSGLSSSDEGEITETNIAFTNINGEQDSDGYYYVTQYIVMEYSEDNVFALYPSSGVNYSIPLSCSKDITLAVKDNSASSEVDTSDSGNSSSDSTSSDSTSSDSTSSDSTSSDSTSSDSTSSDSTSSDSTSSDSTSSDSTSSDSSGGSGGGETITTTIASVDFTSFTSNTLSTTGDCEYEDLTLNDGSDTGFDVIGKISGETETVAKIETQNSMYVLNFGGGVSTNSSALRYSLTAGTYTITVSYFNGNAGRYAVVLGADGTALSGSVADSELTTTDKAIITREMEITVSSDGNIYIGSASSGLYITAVTITQTTTV